MCKISLTMRATAGFQSAAGGLKVFDPECLKSSKSNKIPSQFDSTGGNTAAIKFARRSAPPPPPPPFLTTLPPPVVYGPVAPPLEGFPHNPKIPDPISLYNPESTMKFQSFKSSSSSVGSQEGGLGANLSGLNNGFVSIFAPSHPSSAPSRHLSKDSEASRHLASHSSLLGAPSKSGTGLFR